MTQPLVIALGHLHRGAWEEAHQLVQDDESPLGCWVHGIVHLLEGDRDNAGYWYERAGRDLPPTFDLKTELLALESALER